MSVCWDTRKKRIEQIEGFFDVGEGEFSTGDVKRADEKSLYVPYSMKGRKEEEMEATKKILNTVWRRKDRGDVKEYGTDVIEWIERTYNPDTNEMSSSLRSLRVQEDGDLLTLRTGGCEVVMTTMENYIGAVVEMTDGPLCYENGLIAEELGVRTNDCETRASKRILSICAEGLLAGRARLARRAA